MPFIESLEKFANLGGMLPEQLWDSNDLPEKHMERPRVKLECLRLLATLRLNPARMRLISGFVDTYLRPSSASRQRPHPGVNWTAVWDLSSTLWLLAFGSSRLNCCLNCFSSPLSLA